MWSKQILHSPFRNYISMTGLFAFWLIVMELLNHPREEILWIALRELFSFKLTELFYSEEMLDLFQYSNLAFWLNILNLCPQYSKEVLVLNFI